VVMYPGAPVNVVGEVCETYDEFAGVFQKLDTVRITTSYVYHVSCTM